MPIPVLSVLVYVLLTVAVFTALGLIQKWVETL
ncbi:potassium-transporting ATPase [Mycobacterium sp. smrl_JER01]